MKKQLLDLKTGDASDKATLNFEEAMSSFPKDSNWTPLSINNPNILFVREEDGC